jgi:amidase/6-aminohexanoate-cyclic-dimer hydrolase
MHKDEYSVLDGLGLAQLIRQGEVSAQEALATAKSLLQEKNPSLNAMVLSMDTQATKSINAGLPKGLFTGVPFALKDLGMQYKGVVTSNGSRLFRDTVATHDSTLVQRYKAAGLVICGKSNTPEFGLATTTEPVLFGPTHNPWKHGYSSGGSSGGASALVAAGILPMAHASDGGGSIRIPASCCGLVGLKPTRGRIPLGPTQLEGWGGLSTTHAITKSVRDSAALLDISAGPELGSPYQVTEQTGSFLDCVSKPLAQQKIGLCLTTFNGADIDQEVAEITKANARQLENLGHFVELINVDLNTDNVRDAHGMIALSHLGAMLNAKQTELGRVITQEDIELGSWQNYQYAKEISAPEYAAAAAMIHQHGRVIDTLLASLDCLLTPTMACLPLAHGRIDMMAEDPSTYTPLLLQTLGFTALFNDTGHPAISIPMGMSKNGLPVGSQLVAKASEEGKLLQLAGQIEAAGLFTSLSF